ncbi:MAG: type IX secretion system membrane protein PorP/SprF [Sphingobacteriales bacterium]|nr:MAG: type IX secretion system membrane protein PorP/SprF [Sphingobacteriales bacterium]
MTTSSFFKKLTVLAGLLGAACSGSYGQGIHFSQYYNAPLLVNPANTALLPDASYRVGVNYRQQWASIPVPYTTISGFGEFQLLRGIEGNNWLGIGVAFWDDKAGAGQLQQSRGDLFAAYHLQLGDVQMLSLGASVGTVQRKVDFTKFTFDQQWDGFSFDRDLSSGEPAEIRKTNYLDVGLGLNYALFPNENFYLKMGVAASHLNQPTETFYDTTHRVGLRLTGNVEAVIRASPTVILTPSVYFTTQQSAWEALYGSLAQFRIGGDEAAGSFIVGAFHRWNDAAVGVVGYQWSNLRLTSSYDYTLSSLKPATGGRGAFEVSLLYQGTYKKDMRDSKFACPRF